MHASGLWGHGGTNNLLHKKSCMYANESDPVVYGFLGP